MRRFNPEKELNKIRNGNKNKVLYGIIALLLIVAVGSTYALYQVRHTQKLVFNTVAEFKKRDIYLSVLVDGEYKNDFPTKEEGMLYGGYECDGDAKINFDTDKWQVALYASHPDKCTIKFGHKYEDQSGANYPELYQGMIPVYFENGKIYVADVTSEWYNYDENRWANAVLIDYQSKKSKFYDDNGNLLGGHEVSEEDILQMYVWIPRYKYQIFSLGNTDTPKQVIDIAFEKGDTSSGDFKCTYQISPGTVSEDCPGIEIGKWYTHPAFTFKGTTELTGTELKGFWAGKFEPSDKSDEIGGNVNNIGEITILPGKTSMIYKSVSTAFFAEQKLSEEGNKYNLNSNTVDTHMMKNIEWGAVAYLTQSKYGIYTNDEEGCVIDGMNKTNCEIWINNTVQGVSTSDYGGTYTGCVGDTYNAGVQWNTEKGKPAQCKEANRWNTGGIKASTTGNMYGIYDMAGGSWEYMMGVLLQETRTDVDLRLSGFTTDGETKLPESKYYDLYTFDTSASSQGRGHYGDATKEVMQTFANHVGAWNSGVADFPSFSSDTHSPWFTRGARFDSHLYVGVFTFARGTGVQYWDVTFRSVLSAA